MYIKNREIGTGCIGGKAAGMLLARNILRDEAPELYSSRIEPHDSYYIGADVFYTYAVQSGLWGSRIGRGLSQVRSRHTRAAAKRHVCPQHQGAVHVHARIFRPVAYNRALKLHS